MYTGIRKFLLTLQVLCLLSIAIFQIPIGQGAKLPPSFFTVTIMVPTNNLERLQYAEAISTELAKIGINIELEMKTWAEIIPRVFYEESPPHAEGGYDICFFAVELGSSTDHPGGLIKTQYLDIPPDGFNVMYWSAEKEDQMNYLASSSSDLITAINSNVNLTEARADFYEFQKIWYDCLPNNIIYSQNNVFLISNGLFGYDPLKNPLASFETLWTNSSYPGDNNSLVMVTSLPCSNFNGLIDNRQGGDDAYSNIDYYCSLLPLDSLLGFTPSNEIILPSDYNRSKWNLDSFNTSKPLEIYPRVAKELGSFSSNGLQYNLTVRDDVLWHDGHQLDAWDVLFSYQSHYLVGLEKEWVDAIGESNIESKTGLYSFIVEDKNQDDFFEHISFQFAQKYAPFERDILSLPLIPEHILGDPINHGFSNNTFNITLWNVNPNNWEFHSFNTGNPNDLGGLKGPIGCGPLVFKEYNHLSHEIILEKFENIQWNHMSGEWEKNSSNDHFLVNQTSQFKKPNKIRVIFEQNRDKALESLKNGEVNILDPLFTNVFLHDTAEVRNIVDGIASEKNIRTIIANSTVYQTMCFNPKFEQDGIRHLNLKGVRHAISHMIPRLEIIDQLLNGFGSPSYGPLMSTSWATIPEDELLEYKRTIKASDGTEPEKNATSAYDEYSIKTALAWLKTEGYDVSRWEIYHGFKESRNTPFLQSWLILLSLLFQVYLFKKRNKSRQS